MKIKIPQNILIAINLIKSINGEAYIVGGCVRDSLLGKTPHDYDVTTSLTPDEVTKLFKDYKIINNNGLKHGTVSVIINHEIIEITTYRIDSSCDGRHASVNYTKSLKEDVFRRDFTINALAYNDIDGIIDYVDGQSDLNNKLIRAVGDPFKRFKEDYLRILRALRFSSRYGFKIEENTKKAIFSTYSNLTTLSKERILMELEGILLGDYVLDILLEYKEIFGFLIKELIPCFNFDQKSLFHQHDVYTHIAYVVANTSPIFEIRLAALLHDIGKPLCYTEEIVDNKAVRHFKNHPEMSYELSKTILKRLGVSNKVYTDVLFLVRYHDVRMVENSISVKNLMMKVPNSNNMLFEYLFDLKKSDEKDHINLDRLNIPSLENLYKIYISIVNNKEAYRIRDLAINGKDLTNLGFVGSQISETLSFILKEVVNERLTNDKATILKFIINNKKSNH